jgi:hypothetical protein
MFYARDPLGSRICFVDEKTLFIGHKKAGSQQAERAAGPATPGQS